MTSPLPEPMPDAVAEHPPDPAAGTGRAPKHAGMTALVVAALGVVFGDIGTSPLYSLQTVFSLDHNKVQATPVDVYGVISLVFWSITLIVSVKYVTIVMRADNHGEGGVLALAALIRRMAGPHSALTVRVILLAIVGASLFYGDSVITPAISVLSAVEGLKVAAPSLADLVVPISVTILTILFVSQRFGTHRIGALFGPVMTIWFVVIGAGRADPGAARTRSILEGLSPTLRGGVRGRAPVHRVRRARRGRAVHHRRRGAVRGHGPLRPAADPPGLVLPRLPGADAQLPRPGRR